MSKASQEQAGAPQGPGFFRVLFELSQGYRKISVLLLVLVILGAFFESAGLSLLMPLLSSLFGVDQGGIGGHMQILLQFFPEQYHLEVILGLLTIFFFLKSVLLLSYVGLSTHFAMSLRRRWTTKLLSRYLNAAYLDVITEKQGTLINDIRVEPQQAAKALTLMLQMLSKFVLFLFLLSVLLFTDWKVTLLTLALGGGLFWMMRAITSRFSIATGKQRLALDQEITAVTAESIGGLKEVKLFNLQSRFIKLVDKHTAQFAKIMTRFSLAADMPGYTIEFFVIFLLSIALMVYHLTKGDLQAILPFLSFFVVVTQRMLVYASNTMSLRMKLLSFVPSLNMIHRKINEGISAKQSRGTKDPGRLQKDIVFDDVHFSYDGKTQVFAGLNLTIQRGRMTALVGASGIGKTTIVDLLVGLFSPQQGRILINDIPLQEINEDKWRKHIGYVGQDPLVFNASIRENIMVGNPDADEAAMLQAAKMANIHDVISALAEGYETQVGDRGVSLSGGQRQRLTIARAILRDPDIFIFDEATSALDGESERLILESIENLSRSKTVLVIAHRITTLRKADRLLELQPMGRTIERSYQDILDRQESLEIEKSKAKGPGAQE